MVELQTMLPGRLPVGSRTGLPGAVVLMVEIVSCVVNEFSVP